MDTVRICLFAVAGVTLAILLRQWRGEFVPLLRLALAAVFAGAIIAMSAPLVSYIRTLTEAAGVPGYAEFLLKALGIAVLTQCCAELCRESGESGVASGVELAGKVEILLLALPLIAEILSTARELLSLAS
ncbi:MAG TPA: hypothetical protein DDW30_05030 [Clostridiales bacterium]|nr:hypothetical protein [Clostridiales bacterium]